MEDNVFLATEFVGGAPATQLGVTRALACACPAGLLDWQCERFGGCDRIDVIRPPRNWNTMTLVNPADRTPLTGTKPTIPGGILASNGLLDSIHPNINTDVLFTPEWAWRYWVDLPVLPAPTYGTHLTVFDGLTWTWVKSYGVVRPSPGAPPTGTGTPSVTVRQFVRRTVLHESGDPIFSIPDCVHAPKRKFGRYPLPTTGCFGPWCDGSSTLPPPGTPLPPPFPTSQSQARDILEINYDDSKFSWLAPSYSPVDVTASIDPGLRSLLLDPANVYIGASDAPENWTGSAVGTVMNATSLAVVHDVFFAGDRLGTGGPNGGPCTTELCPDPIAVVSGKRQELVVFGEQTNAVRVRNLATGAESLRMLTKGSIVDPVAATYRAEDDSYYFASRTKPHGGSLNLWRLTPAGAVEWVATWSSFGKATNFSLTTSWKGDLVLSTWSARHHMIAGVSLVPGGIKVGFVHNGKHALAMPGVSDFRGVYYATEAGGVAQDPVRMHTFIEHSDFDFDRNDELDKHDHGDD